MIFRGFISWVIKNVSYIKKFVKMNNTVSEKTKENKVWSRKKYITFTKLFLKKEIQIQYTIGL